MWPLLYDSVLPAESEWHKNGGATAYFKAGGYFHQLLVKVSDMYGQPLQNPGTSVEERFVSFITVILDHIDVAAREISRPQTLEKYRESPGDLVAEVKLVWTKVPPSKENDLYLAFVRKVNFRETFGTKEEVTTYVDFMRQQGGNYKKISTDYLGKRTHSAIVICIKYFEQGLQKRLIKTVSFLRKSLYR